MSSSRRRWLPVGVLLAATLPAPAVDLSKVPRTIPKEPQYQSGKPEYCLVVLGPEADQRCWLVRDGERYFCDRNGNGDLTEAGESWSKEKPKKKKGFLASLFGSDDPAPPAEFKLKVGAKKADATLTVTRFNEADYVALSSDAGGSASAHADVNGKLQFAKSAAAAPIVHFGGALTLGFDEPYQLSRGQETKVYAVLGTPGLGPGTFAIRSYEGVPRDAHPQLEVEFPRSSPGEAPLREKFTLDKRC